MQKKVYSHFSNAATQNLPENNERNERRNFFGIESYPGKRAEKTILEKMAKVVGTRGEIEVMSVSKPVKMLAVEGFKQKVVRFTTDIPHLSNWGQPLLLGAGSILVAHNSGAFILKKDLEEAVELYVNLVKNLLQKEKC